MKDLPLVIICATAVIALWFFFKKPGMHKFKRAAVKMGIEIDKERKFLVNWDLVKEASDRQKNKSMSIHEVAKLMCECSVKKPCPSCIAKKVLKY